jgi:peptidyl-tRNA hydrolase
VVSYLLSPFDEEEWKQVGDVVQQAAQAAEIFVEKGLDPMMQVVNKRA